MSNSKETAAGAITPVGDDSVIENLEKFIPYCDGEAKQLTEAQLEAYKKRRDERLTNQ